MLPVQEPSSDDTGKLEPACGRGAVPTARGEGVGFPQPAPAAQGLSAWAERLGSSGAMLGRTSPLPKPLPGDLVC